MVIEILRISVASIEWKEFKYLDLYIDKYTLLTLFHNVLATSSITTPSVS